MLKHARLPFEDVLAKLLAVCSSRKCGRHVLDEGVGHTVVEAATAHALLAEDEKWKAEAEQGPGFEAIPGVGILTFLTFFWALLPRFAIPVVTMSCSNPRMIPPEQCLAITATFA